MKCPYLIDTLRIDKPDAPMTMQIDWQTADGESKSDLLYNNSNKIVTQHIMQDCIGHECGAWHRGRCRRKS